MLKGFKNVALNCGGTVAVALCFAFPAVAQQTGAADSSDCDRACLEGFVDQYLSALEARDPNLVPLSDDAKFTENGVELRFGDGAWATVTSVDEDYRIYIADTERGEAALIGVMTENWEQPGIMALRIKVEQQEITEAETVWARSIDGAGRLLDRGTPRPEFSQAIPESERLPRNELVAIANTYFTGLQDK